MPAKSNIHGLTLHLDLVDNFAYAPLNFYCIIPNYKWELDITAFEESLNQVKDKINREMEFGRNYRRKHAKIKHIIIN